MPPTPKIDCKHLSNQTLDEFFLDKKEMLDEAESSPAGVFEVNGNTQGRPINETTMVPVVRIYHKCDEDPKKDVCYYTFYYFLLF